MSSIDFSTIMAAKYPTYKWEALSVQAQDEYDSDEYYTLTTYKLWNEAKRDEDKGWVFFQHGGT